METLKTNSKYSKNSILISHARSGTNFFLNSCKVIYPQALCLGEIFRQKGDSITKIAALSNLSEAEIKVAIDKDPISLWEKICQSANQNNNPVIAKIFYYHKKNSHSIWDHFSRKNKIIHLIRRNPFNTLVSRKLANASGSWITNSEERNDGIRFPIEIEEFLHFRHKLEEHIMWTKEKYKNSDYHEIFYEDLGTSPFESYPIIAGIFGGNAIEPSKSSISRRIKQNTLPNNLRVTNYDEVRHFDVDFL